MGEGVIKRVNMEICRKFGVSEKKLYQGKRGEENMARFFAITLARELSGLRMPEIAERYKIASHRTVGTICFLECYTITLCDSLLKLFLDFEF